MADAAVCKVLEPDSTIGIPGIAIAETKRKISIKSNGSGANKEKLKLFEKEETEPSKSFMNNTKEPKHPKLVLLDLDNTLIPTNYIKKQWRRSGGSLSGIEQLRLELNEVKLYITLENMIKDIKQIGIEDNTDIRIEVVTNATQNTVAEFYFKFYLPELHALLERERINIRSTEHIKTNFDSSTFLYSGILCKEYYTAVKCHEFDHVFEEYRQELKKKREVEDVEISAQKCQEGISPKLPEENKESSEKKEEADETIEVISAGDQSCEIVGACLFTYQHRQNINLTKLLHIKDVRHQNSQNPETFVTQLNSMHKELRHALKANIETLDHAKQPQWIKRSRYVHLIISSPTRFSSLQNCLLNSLRCDLCAKKEKKKATEEQVVGSDCAELSDSKWPYFEKARITKWLAGKAKPSTWLNGGNPFQNTGKKSHVKSKEGEHRSFTALGICISSCAADLCISIGAPCASCKTGGDNGEGRYRS